MSATLVVGVAAGSELIISDLRKNPKPALVMTASITAFTWVFVFIAFVLVGGCTVELGS